MATDEMDAEIKAIAKEIQRMLDIAYINYKSLVDSIVMRNASEDEVEHLLDYMLDVCLDDKMLRLFKRVCRRYYKQYPEMIASEIYTYKELYDD